MFKFNSDNILSGYIKQLLASFNLPLCKVYTKDANVCAYIDCGENQTKDVICRTESFIKDDAIQYGESIDNGATIKWNRYTHYSYNVYKPNFTKKLIIKNNIYDSYTHEYLGDFLRFQRDYNNYDLMPLYNCFSNKLCTKLDVSFSWKQQKNTSVSFTTNDKRYKIYMLPIKLFQEYTIAIDSSLPVELMCGFYDKTYYKVYTQDSKEEKYDVERASYKIYRNTAFKNPFIFDTKSLITRNEDGTIQKTYKNSEILKNEKNLKLFIKLPAENTSSISVLEGNYIRYNDWVTSADKSMINPKPTFSIIKNKFVVNHEQNKKQLDDDEINVYKVFKPITQLQLLSVCTKESYPFSDKLIEYLVGNCVTNIDENSDNIARVQNAVVKNCETNKNRPLFKFNGLWDDKIRAYLYDYMNDANYNNKFEMNQEILGFCDKDVENSYSFIQTVTEKNKKQFPNRKIGDQVKQTIANIDIYTDEE